MGLRDWWQDVREMQEHERKAAAAADAAFDREFAAAAEAGQLPPGWSTADLYELRRERQAAELATARALAQEPRPVDMERDLGPRAEGAMQIANPQAFAPPRALQIGIREWMEPGDFELQAVHPETGEAVDDTGGNPMEVHDRQTEWGAEPPNSMPEAGRFRQAFDRLEAWIERNVTNRERLPMFHGGRDADDQEREIERAVAAGQIPVDRDGQLLRDGAHYDLDALREERLANERAADERGDAHRMPVGWQGLEAASQIGETEEQFEDRTYHELLMGAQRAGQLLYGDTTWRETTDVDRLEAMAEERRAAGWTGENADVAPGGLEAAAVARERLWEAMHAVEHVADRGVLHTGDPAERAALEEVLRATEAVELAEGRGLNQTPTPMQAERREAVERIFGRYDVRDLPAPGEHPDPERVAGIAGDRDLAARIADLEAMDEGGAARLIERVTGERVQDMSREELEARAAELAQGIERAAGPASAPGGDMAGWAERAQFELDAINHRTAQIREEDLAQAHRVDAAQEREDLTALARAYEDQWRDAAEEKWREADGQTATSEAGREAPTMASQEFVADLESAIDRGAYPPADVVAGHVRVADGEAGRDPFEGLDEEARNPQIEVLRAEALEAEDAAQVQREYERGEYDDAATAQQEAEDGVRLWAAERGLDAADLTPEQWQEAEAANWERQQQANQAAELAATEEEPGLLPEDGIPIQHVEASPEAENGGENATDWEAVEEAHQETEAFVRDLDAEHERRMQAEQNGELPWGSEREEAGVEEKAEVTAETEQSAEAQVIEQHEDREEREHWGMRDGDREVGDPEVDHEELINPHGVIGGEEAERATEARAAADLVDREEPLRSHPTVDWTIFHSETAAPQHQHEAERGLEMEM
jgi:hypothetical protein